MGTFPAFLKSAPNAVLIEDPETGMEGYVFEGADGSQIVFWTCEKGGVSRTHVHDYDEYACVVEGSFVGMIGTEEVRMGPGDECVIPAGVPHSGSYSDGYRAIDAFGSKRVRRAAPGSSSK